MRLVKKTKKNPKQLSNFKFYWIFFLLNLVSVNYCLTDKYYIEFKNIIKNSKNFSHLFSFYKKKKLNFKNFNYSFGEIVKIKRVIGYSYIYDIKKLQHIFNFIFITGLPVFFFKKITAHDLLFNKKINNRNDSFLFYSIGMFNTIKCRHASYLLIFKKNFVGMYSNNVYRFFFYFNTFFYRNLRDNFFIKKFNKLSMVWWSVRKNFFIALTTIDNLDDYYMQLDFLGFWSSGLFLALFNLPKSVKHRVFFKILIVKHVRRTMIIMNFFRFLFNFKNYVYDFKILWNVFNSSLQEVFVNPDSKKVVLDISLNPSKIDSQLSVFKDRVLSFSSFNTIKEKEDYWDFFISDFKRLLKFNKVGGIPNLVRYRFNCDMIVILRKETFTIQKRKKAKSLKKRMTKRIVKEAKRRHWVF